MMTLEQYWLGKIAEEANEIGQRALKAQQYGLNEVQSGQEQDNTERMVGEIYDMLSMLGELQLVTGNSKLELTEGDMRENFGYKFERRHKYLALAVDLGKVTPQK